MFDFEFLDIIIGLVFVYMLLSLLATIVNEIITTIFSLRGKELEKAIQLMLDDDNNNKVLANKFYQQPLIQKFAERKDNKPSYLTRYNFSKTLLDLLGNVSGKSTFTFSDVEEAIKNLPKGNTRYVLQSFLNESSMNLQQFRAFLEIWYDEMMDRASGWYKRKVQKYLLLIGFVIAIIFNADTFRIANKLASDPEASAAVLSLAEQYTADYDALNTANNSDSASLNKAKELMNEARNLVENEILKASSILGMGWEEDIQYFRSFKKSSRHENDPWWIFQKIAGWIFTALAISLGAPFWFDILKKVMQIRGSGIKPEEKKITPPASVAQKPTGLHFNDTNAVG